MSAAILPALLGSALSIGTKSCSGSLLLTDAVDCCALFDKRRPSFERFRTRGRDRISFWERRHPIRSFIARACASTRNFRERFLILEIRNISAKCFDRARGAGGNSNLE